MAHILILGGTNEARHLADRLMRDDNHHVILSLAGRTRTPQLPQTETRIGGFGGADGLAEFLRREAIDLLVNATHPFAARMAFNAAAAAAQTQLPLLVLTRPPWRAEPADIWLPARDMGEAARLLGETPRRVFLAIGRQEVSAFKAAPQHHYLIRSVETVTPDALPPNATAIEARGPFPLDEELRLLEKHRCELVVTKNSGGAATYGKIVAARHLGLPVVLVTRPPRPGVNHVGTEAEAANWISDHFTASRTERGA